MVGLDLVESKLEPTRAVYSQEIPAGEPWIHPLRKGQYFRIVDLHDEFLDHRALVGDLDVRAEALRFEIAKLKSAPIQLKSAAELGSAGVDDLWGSEPAWRANDVHRLHCAHRAQADAGIVDREFDEIRTCYIGREARRRRNGIREKRLAAGGSLSELPRIAERSGAEAVVRSDGRAQVH